MSFGSAIGAIVSLKNNKRERRARVENHLNSSGAVTAIKSHRQPSPEELHLLKKRIIQEQDKRQRKIILITVAFFGGILGFLLYFLLWF